MILQSKIYPKQANYKFKTLIYDLFRASLIAIIVIFEPFDGVFKRCNRRPVLIA